MRGRFDSGKEREEEKVAKWRSSPQFAAKRDLDDGEMWFRRRTADSFVNKQSVTGVRKLRKFLSLSLSLSLSLFDPSILRRRRRRLRDAVIDVFGYCCICRCFVFPPDLSLESISNSSTITSPFSKKEMMASRILNRNVDN